MDDEPLDATLENTPAELPPKPQSWRDAVDNPWIVLGMLFFVTAACGLPVLWLSRGFSPLWKVVLTLVVCVYTVVILWAFWLFMAHMWEHHYAPYLT